MQTHFTCLGMWIAAEYSLIIFVSGLMVSTFWRPHCSKAPDTTEDHISRKLTVVGGTEVDRLKMKPSA